MNETRIVELNAYPLYELHITMNNGDDFYFFGKFQPKIIGKIKMIGDCIPLYSKRECDRIGTTLDDIPWIDLPYGDLTCDIKDGLVTINKGDNCIFMAYRNMIKSSVTILPEEFAVDKPNHKI